MANPSCPRCGGHTILNSRHPVTTTCRYSCRDCDHVFVRRDPA